MHVIRHKQPRHLTQSERYSEVKAIYFELPAQILQRFSKSGGEWDNVVVDHLENGQETCRSYPKSNFTKTIRRCHYNQIN